MQMQIVPNGLSSYKNKYGLDIDVLLQNPIIKLSAKIVLALSEETGRSGQTPLFRKMWEMVMEPRVYYGLVNFVKKRTYPSKIGEHKRYSPEDIVNDAITEIMRQASLNPYYFTNYGHKREGRLLREEETKKLFVTSIQQYMTSQGGSIARANEGGRELKLPHGKATDLHNIERPITDLKGRLLGYPAGRNRSQEDIMEGLRHFGPGQSGREDPSERAETNELLKLLNSIGTEVKRSPYGAIWNALIKYMYDPERLSYHNINITADVQDMLSWFVSNNQKPPTARDVEGVKNIALQYIAHMSGSKPTYASFAPELEYYLDNVIKILRKQTIPSEQVQVT